jgi:thiol:disulfide interchange protein DsbD
VIDYGYQDSVLLPVVVQPPGTLPAPGSTVTFSAEVSWIVCKDLCLPGKADLTLSLPVRTAPGSASASHGLFEEAKARLPKPLPVDWTVTATSDPAAFVLTIHGAGLGQASFFPLEADQLDNAGPQTRTAFPGGVRLTVRKSDQLSRTPDHLDGVLDLGSGRTYAVSAPVRPQAE